jgi:4-hydroxy 2-oxovalerate aldolase
MDKIKSDARTIRREAVQWLDCTLRDGGYYNSWDFSHEIVQEYLFAMAECGAGLVELGFRSLDNTGYRGPTAFTTDSFLNSLELPAPLRIGVMVNTHELVNSDGVCEATLGRLFSEKSSDKVAFVRLATHLDELATAVAAAQWLKNRNYLVAINLMQVSEASADRLSSTAALVDPDTVDVLYLADSLGNLSPGQTAGLVSLILGHWSGPIGIHAHDNGGLALANTLAAVDAGASWVDSTITGMGRGAGNTASELLLGHLRGDADIAPNSDRLERIIDTYFEPERRKARWGPNIHYVRAAAKSVHPTFVQEMLGNAAYSSIELGSAIDHLASMNAQRFTREGLEAAETWVGDAQSPRSAWDQSDLFRGAKVLFVGSGPTGLHHNRALEILAQDPSVIVVAANASSALGEEFIDARIACHPLRLVSDASFHEASSCRLIAPAALLPEKTKNVLMSEGKLLDIGLTIDKGPPRAEPGLIGLSQPLVLPFALLVALSGGAREVMLAGFDGYPESDPRRKIEQTMIDKILEMGSAPKIRAVTPTEFDLPQSSIYGLMQ